ncbi:Hep/Hag repeat protein, partial [Anaerococcus hydrogenalis]
VGTSSEIKDDATLATSVGHANTIQGSEQYGLALGNKLLVEGYGSIAVGTESKATADYATAIGQGATAEKKSSIAIGAAAKTKTRGGIAIGSSSLADRDKRVYGYNPLTKTSYDEASIKAMYDPSEVKEMEGYAETIAQKEQEKAAANRRYNELRHDYDDMFDGKGDIPYTPENRAKLEKEMDEALDAFDNAAEESAAAQKQINKITSPYQSTAAALAVGNEKAGITRQITGVAAGSENTDAVNVAQLKALESTVNDGMTGLDTRITTNTEK